ncbi:MAG: beta-galactosidase [Bacteroidales bacterium]
MTMKNDTFTVRDNLFFLNGKEVFLNSGEIHYFRIKREYWDSHLAAAREAGLMAVSSYVPWDWHEPQEGVYDFDGTTIAERDLKGWLQKCKEHGLKAIVKPGPYILAEYRGAGLPEWFLDKYEDDVRMRNRKGDKISSEGVNLFHPIYLDKVKKWYDNIMPLISKYEVSRGGPVIMMQICNEIGLFSWLAHQADYGGDVQKRFIVWAKEKYSEIDRLNRIWGTNYKQFNEIELPPDVEVPFASKNDRARDFDWHFFWRSYYADYLKMLVRMARERGVTVPFYHNLPGWIYGHGFEFPVNITMYDELYGDKSNIIFGVDHIPEFMSHRNMHDDRIINDITAAMQGNKPLFAAEFQSGSREYHVVTSPRETELFYKASIANGLTGWNYYMFSQGRNPERKGYSGDTFYWFNPLTAEGERTSAFPLVKKMSRIVSTLEHIIVDAKRKANICILFYPPYYTSELERPEKGASDLDFVATAIRRPAFFDGLLKVLQVLNIDYDMHDLTKISNKNLQSYKQVWAFCTDEMDARDQQVLVDYTKDWGNLVIFPHLPDREISQQPCTIIRDALRIVPSGKEIIDSPLVDIYDMKDIKCANPQIVYSEESLHEAEIIAKTLNGKACGFEKRLGKGIVLHLGIWLGFDTEGHKPVYETIIRHMGGKSSHASASTHNITVRQRFTFNNKALLFAGNYYNEEQTGKVTYTHPETGEIVHIPYLKQEMLWPALYAFLSPVCFEVAGDIKILHTTSDILSVEKTENQFTIKLSGDRDLVGEIVFEGKNSDKISSVTIDNGSANITRHENRFIVNYTHEHKKEMEIKVKLK